MLTKFPSKRAFWAQNKAMQYNLADVMLTHMALS